MDVISAMEAVEDASGKYTPRKKTPPSGSQDEKKRLIRELGKSCDIINAIPSIFYSINVGFLLIE